MPLYDAIGAGYSATRRPDPRIATRMLQALGDAGTVANVGAGTGSYEPKDRKITAGEPSMTMIRQRPAGFAPVIQAAAESLPLADSAVDAALAILTVHHWKDPAPSLAEMRRAARRRAEVYTWDINVWESFWLIREYVPAIGDLDRHRAVPVADIADALGAAEILTVPIPHDCQDGFHGAFWRRPEAYLDPRVRAEISTYSLMAPAARHGDLLEAGEWDLGYRLMLSCW